MLYKVLIAKSTTLQGNVDDLKQNFYNELECHCSDNSTIKFLGLIQNYTVKLHESENVN